MTSVSPARAVAVPLRYSRAGLRCKQVGANPGDMAMDVLRQVPEQRVAAVLGIPAAVLGFGSGLDATKVGATMAQMERQAIRNGVLPDAEEIAETLTMQLNIAGVRIGLDTSAVLALQPDQEMLTRVWNLRVAGGVAITRRGPHRVEAADNAGGRGIPDAVRGGGATCQGSPWPQMPAMRNQRQKVNPLESTGQLKQGPDDVDDLMRRLALSLDGQVTEFTRRLHSMQMALGEMVGDVFWQHQGESANEIADAIVARVRQWQLTQFAEANAQMWRTMLTVTVGDVNGALGLAINIPDEVSRRVLELGGRRLGLIDLSEATKRHVFQIMEDAGINQTSMREIQRQIADAVPRGRWTTSEIRARVIARTEVKYAQNVSSIEVYDAGEDITSVVIFDAQIGPTDEECERLDGFVVTFEEARALADTEHPNGTRSFGPVVRPPPEA